MQDFVHQPYHRVITLRFLGHPRGQGHRGQATGNRHGHHIAWSKGSTGFGKKVAFGQGSRNLDPGSV